MSVITDTVAAFAGPVAEKYGCELWDVEYVKEAAGWFLRVYIDKADGVSITDCEAVNREVDKFLDEREDLIPGSYTFEVSSAGAERRLKRPSDFERFIGRFVEVKLYRARDGRKEYTGNLTGYNNGDVEIGSGDARYTFAKDEVASVRLRIDGGFSR